MNLSTARSAEGAWEIWIRKVLGASTPTLARLLIEEFKKLVLLADLISWPIAYFVMRN